MKISVNGMVLQHVIPYSTFASRISNAIGKRRAEVPFLIGLPGEDAVEELCLFNLHFELDKSGRSVLCAQLTGEQNRDIVVTIGDPMIDPSFYGIAS